MYSMPVPTYGLRARSSGTASVDTVLHEAAVLVDLRVRLRNDVLILLPGRQVERIGLELDALLLRAAVRPDEIVGLHDIGDLVLRVAAGVGDHDVIDNA